MTVGPRAAFGAECEGAEGFLNSPTRVGFHLYNTEDDLDRLLGAG